MSVKLVLASKNPGKLQELEEILGDLGIEFLLESQVGLDLEIEETGTTFEENSFLKAETVQKACGLPAIADDSGLAVDFLNGAPGIYSARFGNLDSDAARTAYLLERLKGVPFEKRTARFISVVTCCLPDGRCVSARGVCEGMITETPIGSNGFGYDPVFYIPSLGKTLAQMEPDEKNRISHRGKALRAFAVNFQKEVLKC